MANADERLVSASIAIPASPFDIKLSLWEWFNLESNYDYGKVEVSTDGGANWTAMDARTGNSGSIWRKSEILLNQFKGQSIKLGFHLTSDGTVQYEGWYIDDLEISIFQPKGVSATMTNLNSQNFPFIYLNVGVDTNGVACSNLTQSNFKVFENGTLQTNYFNVTSPNSGGGVRRADIIFLMDNSGSMGTYQSAIANNVNDFVNNLVASGVDFALGLCRYGDSPNNGSPFIEDNGILTSNANYFKNNIWTRNTVNGGTEPGYYAITQSASGFSFRPGAQRIFIEITDETPNQGGATINDAETSCSNNSIALFALTDSLYLYNDFYPITSASHGQIFSVTSPFDNILSYISQTISNSYVVQYRSSNPVMDGVLRNVKVVVNNNVASDTAHGSYIPGAAPQIILTSATNALFNQPSVNNVPLTISADVTDNIVPFVTQVNLFYKNTSDSIFKMVEMPLISGTIFSVTIPANDVIGPGIDFYVTAIDGQNTSSLPSVDPAVHPFQIAVLPNYAPVITHTPIVTAPFYQQLLISASVIDNTLSVTNVKLYYRVFGQLIYQVLPMVFETSTNTYKATIPAIYITSNNLEYYIRATDNFNVSATHGTADSPHLVFTATGVDELTGNTFQSSNFPNPFSESTTITYNVLAKSAVTIIVFDSKGNLIEKLVNTISDSGSYKVVFSTKDFLAGVYYYSLMEESPSRGVIVRETRKMAVVK